MKSRTNLILGFWVLFLSFSHIVNAETNPTMRIQISRIQADGRVTVAIVNEASTDMSIWEESNSWGYGRWRIYVIRDGKISTRYQNPDANFTRNIPAYKRLKPNDAVRFNLDLNDGSWISVAATPNGFMPRDKVIVAYDVPVSDESRKMNVWCGAVAAIVDVE
jgi:hypothetical protein